MGKGKTALIPLFQYLLTGKRDVKAIRVKCDNLKGGCEWEGTVGTLEEHMTTCVFTPVPCPNDCTDQEDIVRMIMKKNLERHLKELCMKREYKCQHCGEKGTYETIIHVHEDECPMKVLPCFNPGCSKTMRRMDIPKHSENHCKYSVISCKYEGIGCDVKMKRIDMGAHEQDDKAHLHQALNTVVKLQDDIVSVKEKMNDMAVKLKSAIVSVKEKNDIAVKLKSDIVSVTEKNDDMAVKLVSVTEKNDDMAVKLVSVKEKNDDMAVKLKSAIVSVKEENDDRTAKLKSAIVSVKNELKDISLTKRVFKLAQYEKKKNDKEIFNSQSFSTATDGYKMQIKVYPNGEGDGEGTHVSVHVPILKGDNDDNLKWPFIGTVKIELLNQLEDKNHHLMILSLDEENNACADDDWGFSEFISHSTLPHDPVKNIEYLKDDTLYFRVSVEVSDHKSWLECTL